MTIKEIQEGYLTSICFKNIYLYLVQNKLRFSKAAIIQAGAQAEFFYYLTSYCFRIQNYHDGKIQYFVNLNLL